MKGGLEVLASSHKNVTQVCIFSLNTWDSFVQKTTPALWHIHPYTPLHRTLFWPGEGSEGLPRGTVGDAVKATGRGDGVKGRGEAKARLGQ